MKKLLSFQKFNYERQVGQLERLTERMYDVMVAYNTMQLSEITINDFKPLFSNPAEFVYDKITDGKDVSIAGLKIDKLKAMEIIHKPTGYAEFLSIADGIKKWLSAQLPSISFEKITSLNKLFDLYELDELGMIMIKKSVVDRIRLKNEIYAESELAKDVLNFAEKVCELLNENNLWKKASSIDYLRGDFKTFMQFLFKVDDKKQVNINPDFIDKFN